MHKFFYIFCIFIFQIFSCKVRTKPDTSILEEIKNDKKNNIVKVIVYVLRHAEGIHNIPKNNYTWLQTFKHPINITRDELVRLFTTDPTLSNKGKNHSREVRKILQIMSMDKNNPKSLDAQNILNLTDVFSSALLRAIETAGIVFPNNEIKVAPFLREIVFLPYLENKVSKIQNQKNKLSKDIFNRINFEYVIDNNGNYVKAATERKQASFNKFIEFLSNKVLPKKNLDGMEEICIGVVTHSHLMRRDLPKFKTSKKPKNNAIVKLVYHYIKDQKKLVPDPSYSITSFDNESSKEVIFKGFS